MSRLVIVLIFVMGFVGFCYFSCHCIYNDITTNLTLVSNNKPLQGNLISQQIAKYLYENRSGGTVGCRSCLEDFPYSKNLSVSDSALEMSTVRPYPERVRK